MSFDIKLTDEDINRLRQGVVDAIAEQFRTLNVELARKHAYTITEAAEQIGYKPDTVRSFVRKGRRGRNGKMHFLKAVEITVGDLRVLPADLDEFLSHF